MTETQERFVRAILTRVPLDGVVELHLFPPIRRGTLETGVAVIAIELPPVALVVDLDSVLDTNVVETTIVETTIVETTDVEATDVETTSVETTVVETPVGADDAAVLEIVASKAVDNEAVDVETVADAVTEIAVADAVAFDVDATDASEPAAAESQTVYTDAAQTAAVQTDAVQAEAARAAPNKSDATALSLEHGPSEPFQHDNLFDGAVNAAAEAAAPSARAYRLRILTASYRLTVKGVERGKWIFDAQEEADAPLDAVEAVLRGVRHRSTEPADPELVSRDMMLHLVAPRAVAPAA